MKATRSKVRKAVTAHPRAVRETPGIARPWLLLALIVVTAAAYSNSFVAPLLIDDQSSIVDNPSIRHLWPVTDVLRAPKQFPTSGRPVINLSLAFNYALGGLSPVGYRVVNLAVHILCGLILFGIIRRTLDSMDSNRSSLASPSSLAFASALIWLVHPLQTEVIDYVTQRTESMMGLFYLLTLYCAIRGMSSSARRVWWYLLAALACAIGMACKESMVTAPLMVLVYDRVFVAESFQDALRTRRWLYVGLAASWSVLIGLNISGPRFRSAGFSSGISPWTYFLNQLVLVSRYLRLVVWPRGLVVDYGVPRSLHLWDVWPFAVALILLLAATAVAWWRHPKVGFLGFWCFITLAPTSSFVPIATEVGAERRMYLPMCALVTLIVWGANHLTMTLAAKRGRAGRASQALGAILVAVTAVLIVLTVQRNAEYRASPSVLWQTVLDRYPHARAHYNLGVVLREEGRREEALREYQTAAAGLPDADYALGFELVQDKKYADAAQRLRRYIQLRPEDVNVVRAYNLLGLSLTATNALDDAMDAFRRALRIQPRNLDALAGLAEALLRRERLDEAITTYEEYIRLAPPNATVYFNLGLALGRQRRDQEAVVMFARAVDLEPREPAYRANLASGLLATGRTAEAVEQYRRTAELEPDPATRDEIIRIVEQLAPQAPSRQQVPTSRR